MVTWGDNTVHNIPGTPAPAGPSSAFGAPAPAPGGFFGNPAPSPSLFGVAPTSTFGTPTSTFGTPAQTPAPSIFGTPAAPAPTGLFGTPAPSSSLFGAPAPSFFGSPTPAPAPFGSMMGSMMGSPAPSLFGQQQQQQQPQQPQIPAQAALQAHMEAMNRAETEKIKAELSKLWAVYDGTVTPTTSSDAKNNFVCIVYNDLTQEHRQLQWLHGMGAGGQMIAIAPPKPPQVSEEDWMKAVARNPDPLSYMPVALVGADALSARVSWQQERSKLLARQAESIRASHLMAKDIFAQGHKRLEQIRREHSNHRKRLLQVMKKVEVVRCMNQPTQPDEVRVMERLRDVDREVRQVRQLLGELEIRARSARSNQNAALLTARDISVPDIEEFTKILSEHREELKKASETLAQDLRDVELIKERVVPRFGGHLPYGR